MSPGTGAVVAPGACWPLSIIGPRYRNTCSLADILLDISSFQQHTLARNDHHDEFSAQASSLTPNDQDPGRRRPHARRQNIPRRQGLLAPGIDRLLGQIDVGNLPPAMINESMELFMTEVAPVVRRETAKTP
jgi:hypothetical protein